jgi:hypothetical protein
MSYYQLCENKSVGLYGVQLFVSSPIILMGLSRIRDVQYHHDYEVPIQFPQSALGEVERYLALAFPEDLTTSFKERYFCFYRSEYRNDAPQLNRVPVPYLLAPENYGQEFLIRNLSIEKYELFEWNGRYAGELVIRASVHPMVKPWWRGPRTQARYFSDRLYPPDPKHNAWKSVPLITLTSRRLPDSHTPPLNSRSG